MLNYFPPCTTTWLLGTRICCPSLVWAYCRMVAPGWAVVALAMVSVCRPCTPSVPLLASWMAPPWVMATAEGHRHVLELEYYVFTCIRITMYISGINFCTSKTITSALICVPDNLCLIQFKLLNTNNGYIQIL